MTQDTRGDELSPLERAFERALDRQTAVAKVARPGATEGDEVVVSSGVAQLLFLGLDGVDASEMERVAQAFAIIGRDSAVTHADVMPPMKWLLVMGYLAGRFHASAESRLRDAA